MIEEDKKRTTDQPTIERQMLLAQFACQSLCLYVGGNDCTVEEIAADCFRVAEAMLAEFERRVK